MNGLEAQAPLAQEGIRWLVCVIPAILLAVAAAAIARYPLDDALKLFGAMPGKGAQAVK